MTNFAVISRPITFALRLLPTLTVGLLLIGCGSADNSGKMITLSDGLQVETLPPQVSSTGRDDVAWVTGAFLYRFRVTLPAGRPVLHCQIERWNGDRFDSLPAAQLEYEPKNGNAVEVLVGIEPMNTLASQAKSVKYFFRIADQGTSSLEPSPFRQLYSQDAAARPISQDRFFLVAAHRDKTKISLSDPTANTAALVLSMFARAKN